MVQGPSVTFTLQQKQGQHLESNIKIFAAQLLANLTK